MPNNINNTTKLFGWATCSSLRLNFNKFNLTVINRSILILLAQKLVSLILVFYHTLSMPLNNKHPNFSCLLPIICSSMLLIYWFTAIKLSFSDIYSKWLVSPGLNLFIVIATQFNIKLTILIYLVSINSFIIVAFFQICISWKIFYQKLQLIKASVYIFVQRYKKP